MKVKLVNKEITKNYGEELLRERGIEDVVTFLNPNETSIQTWKDLDNIEEGLRLVSDLSRKNIAIVVDCDIDGFTSASIIGQYLKRNFNDVNISYYIHEGKAHGLEEHWSEIQDEDYSLVILPDAGSNDKQYAAQINCPVLIIDHHLVDDLNFSDNMVVINNQLSEKYQNKDLSGAGMAYQFCRAMDDYFGNSWADDYLDLAALGICGDMMSGLREENQYFWKKGFSKINNYFFLTIARKQGYSITGKMNPTDKDIIKKLTPTSVAFYIVPLINAMVRVGSQEEKRRMLEAFLDGKKMIPSLKRGAKGTLEECAVESVRECVNARAKQNRLKDDAVFRLEQKIFKYNLLENKILFIRLDEDDQLPSELNGLVAMQLMQKYKHPTIVARLNEEGYIRGSIRGLSNSEMPPFKSFLDSTGLFEYVQGHELAAGCSIKNDNLFKLHNISNELLSKYNFDENYYEVNFERNGYDNDIADIIYDLSKFEGIWSQKNPQALIYVKNLYIDNDDIQIIGKSNNTLKITKNGVVYMKFFADELIDQIKNGSGRYKLEIVGTPNVNEWNGNVTPQIFIDACEIKEDSITDF